EIQEARKTITTRYESEMRQAEREFAVNRRRIIEQVEEERETAKTEYQETRWTITAVHEGSKNGAENVLKEAQEQVGEFGRRCRSLRARGDDYLAECRMRSNFPTEPTTGDATMADFDPLFLVRQEIDLAEAKLQELKRLTIPPYFRGEKLVWITAAAWLLSIVPARLVSGDWLYGLIGSALVVLFVCVGVI